jgi:hypothetical protein
MGNGSPACDGIRNAEMNSAKEPEAVDIG